MRSSPARPHPRRDSAHIRAGTRPTSAPGLGPHPRRDSAHIRAGTRPALPRRPLAAGRRAGVYATMNGSRKNYQCHQPRRAASTFETAAVQGCPRSGLPPLGVAPIGYSFARRSYSKVCTIDASAAQALVEDEARLLRQAQSHICAGTGLTPATSAPGLAGLSAQCRPTVLGLSLWSARLQSSALGEGTSTTSAWMPAWRGGPLRCFSTRHTLLMCRCPRCSGMSG